MSDITNVFIRGVLTKYYNKFNLILYKTYSRDENDIVMNVLNIQHNGNCKSFKDLIQIKVSS